MPLISSLSFLILLINYIIVVHEISEARGRQHVVIEYIGDTISDAKYLSYSQSDGFVHLSENADTARWTIEETFKYDNMLRPGPAVRLNAYPFKLIGQFQYYGSLQRSVRTDSNDGYDAVVKPLRDNVHHIYEDKWSIERFPGDGSIAAIGTVDDDVHNRRYLICSGVGWHDRCKLKKLDQTQFEERFKFKIDFKYMNFQWSRFRIHNLNYEKFNDARSWNLRQFISFGTDPIQYTGNGSLMIYKNCYPLMPDGYVITVWRKTLTWEGYQTLVDHVLEWDLTKGYENAIHVRWYWPQDFCDEETWMDHSQNGEGQWHGRLWRITESQMVDNRRIYKIETYSPDPDIRGILSCDRYQEVDPLHPERIREHCRIRKRGEEGNNFDGWYAEHNDLVF